LSDVQEAAQLLSGEHVPSSLLGAVLGKIRLGGATVVNITPYDAWLERVCLDWHKTEPIRISHISVSLNGNLIDYVQKVLALKLMEVRIIEKWEKRTRGPFCRVFSSFGSGKPAANPFKPFPANALFNLGWNLYSSLTSTSV